MSLFSSLLKILPDASQEQKALSGLTVQQPARLVGFNGVTLYPANSGEQYIRKGFNYNAAVYFIVSRCAQKFGEVPVYHYKVKRNERKTLEEYKLLMKAYPEPGIIIEMKKMRKKALDESIVDSDLSKLLSKPNRNQAGDSFFEQLYGYKLLTGEGNIWLNKGTDIDDQGRLIKGKKPIEMILIPKGFLSLNTDGFESIASYNLHFNGENRKVDKEDIIMWKFPNYNFNTVTYEHLRGFAPLEAGLRTLQADNEAVERLINMNNNQGAAGLLYRKDAMKDPGTAQAQQIRQQINETINTKDVAGMIAVLAGEWGYHRFGLDAEQLKMLEQMGANQETLCNIFNTPSGLFKTDQTYENMKENERRWIHSNIGPAAHSLRNLLNETLVPAFGLDRERDFIDFSITDLPELAVDLQKQIAAVKDADFLKQNEKRAAVGYEPEPGPAWEAAYMASGKQTVEQTFEGVSGDLTDEEETLNGE